MNKEVELILLKLKVVSEEKERGLYLCDKEHSKLLLDYIKQLQQENKQLKDNWNKLKEIAKSQSDFKLKCHNESLWFEVDELLNKMKELEKGNQNDK